MIVFNILIDFALSIIEVDNLVKFVMFVMEGIIIGIKLSVVVFVAFFFWYFIDNSFFHKILKNSFYDR